MKIHQDCHYFKGNMPCTFHKQQGIHCANCQYYEKIAFKILIIKLDAVGDVLRTTCLLQGLKGKYQDSHITWLTRKNAVELFENNDLVDTVLDCSIESLIQIQLEKYDLVINVDATPLSAQLAMLSKGDKKIGFGYDEKGFVYSFNKEAQKWFEMGLFDDVKKANTQSYQSIILDICGLNPSKHEIIFRLSEEERQFANEFKLRHGITQEIIIGLNTGAGKRWKQKSWTIEGYCGLIELITAENKGHEYENRKKQAEAECQESGFNTQRILLLGGPEEIECNKYLAERYKNIVIDTGCNNTLRKFGALVDLCDIVVTGDTFAMHIAIGLGKKVIALFGPTSHTEIELYGRGKKIYAGSSSNFQSEDNKLNCLCCYKKDCDIHPNCMELITPQQVLNAICALCNQIM